MQDDETVAEVDDVETNEVDAEEVETQSADSEEQAAAEPKEGEAEQPSESSPENEDDGFEKRAAKLTERYYTEKQQKEYYKQLYDELAQRNQPPMEAGKTLADFDYDENQFAQYLDAQARQRAVIEAQQQAQQEQQRRKTVEFRVKEEAFAKDVPDYQQVAYYSPITPEVADVIMSSEQGPELAYYLGKHPDVAEKLSMMGPLDMAREVGRIESTKLVKPKPPSVTNAPKPVPQIQGTDDKPPIRLDDPKISDAQFRRLREKQIANR
jgi:hypothetical protein